MTRWINGVEIAEIDTARLQAPHDDRDNDPGIGLHGWAPRVAYRWRWFSSL